MAQSPEYPDLRWVVPRSWTAGRPRNPQLIVMHTTEGSRHDMSAEDGAAYDARRTDGTSCHYFVDSNSIIQCVRTRDTAHHARRHGNYIGIGYELCGRAAQTSAQWHDAYGTAQLRLAAKQAARDAKKWGFALSDIRRLSVSQVRAAWYTDTKLKGFCGHVDVTYAFPEDNGTHTDPGSNFPWTDFLNMVRAELTSEEDELNSEQANQLADTYYTTTQIPYPGVATRMALHVAFNRLVTETKANFAALANKDWVNEDQIIDGVLQGLGTKDLDDVAAALKAVFGDRIAELAAKLTSA